MAAMEATEAVLTMVAAADITGESVTLMPNQLPLPMLMPLPMPNQLPMLMPTMDHMVDTEATVATAATAATTVVHTAATDTTAESVMLMPMLMLTTAMVDTAATEATVDTAAMEATEDTAATVVTTDKLIATNLSPKPESQPHKRTKSPNFFRENFDTFQPMK